jgi:hypothetical protein
MPEYTESSDSATYDVPSAYDAGGYDNFPAQDSQLSWTTTFCL